MSTVVQSVRPSSLPLPKTISHSSPVDNLNLRRNSAAIFRTSLVFPTKNGQRIKLSSTSSSTNSNSTSGSPCGFGYERQVKSLTPDRDFMTVKQPVKRITSFRRQQPSAKIAENEQNNKVRASAGNEKLSAKGANLDVKFASRNLPFVLPD